MKKRQKENWESGSCIGLLDWVQSMCLEEKVNNTFDTYGHRMSSSGDWRIRMLWKEPLCAGAFSKRLGGRNIWDPATRREQRIVDVRAETHGCNFSSFCLYNWSACYSCLLLKVVLFYNHDDHRDDNCAPLWMKNVSFGVVTWSGRRKTGETSSLKKIMVKIKRVFLSNK